MRHTRHFIVVPLQVLVVIRDINVPGAVQAVVIVPVQEADRIRYILQTVGPAPLGIRAAVVYAEDPDAAAQRVNRRGVLRAIATAIAVFAVPITT